MAELYTLVQEGNSPISLDDVKDYLYVVHSNDDVLIRGLMRDSVNYAELYTRRSFRDNDWALAMDDFPPSSSYPICIRRNPVDSVSVILNYTVSGSPVLIDSSTYQVKQLVDRSEIWLNEDEDWPTDKDDIQYGVNITFSTTAYWFKSIWQDGMFKYIANMYENRGDFPASKSPAVGSGANFNWDKVAIAQVP